MIELKTLRVEVGASALTPVTLPAPVRGFIITPNTGTIDLQVSWEANQSNTAGQFFVLRAGQTLTLESQGSDQFANREWSFFATSALTVFVVYWQ